jgi:hypothetical protein
MVPMNRLEELRRAERRARFFGSTTFQEPPRDLPRVYAEYEEILTRPRFQRSEEVIANTLQAIRVKGS